MRHGAFAPTNAQIDTVSVFLFSKPKKVKTKQKKQISTLPRVTVHYTSPSFPLSSGAPLGGLAVLS